MCFHRYANLFCDRIHYLHNALTPLHLYTAGDRRCIVHRVSCNTPAVPFGVSASGVLHVLQRSWPAVQKCEVGGTQSFQS